MRETAWLYALGVAAFSLLISIDFLTVWSRYLIDYGVSLGTVATVMLYKVPHFLHLTLPIAAVFAVLLATGRLAKDSELKAAYASGVPPISLLAPLLGFGLLVSALTLANNGWLEPRAETASARLVDSFAYARPTAETRSDVSYVIPDGGVYYAGRMTSNLADRDLADLRGVTVIREDGTIYSAPDGVWNSVERTWTLTRAEVVEPEEAPRVLAKVTLPFVIDSDAATALTSSAELTLSELWERLNGLRAGGSETREAAFHFHQRIADAFSAFVFVLIAGTLGLNLRGRAAGFGWTIVLLVVFYALYTVAGNLFEERVLSAMAAAWFTAGLVGLFGMVLAFVRLR